MKELYDLGLSKLEADVYLILQELGEAKTGAICKKLKIPNSHIYPALEKLKENGLVSYKFANKIKVFKATDPQTLQLLFQKKQQELQSQEKNLLSLIENLKKLPKNKETNVDYQYFEGIAAVKGMILEAYSTAPKQSSIQLLSAVSESWEVLNAFFLEMHKIRVNRGILLRMIMQEKTKNLKKYVLERKKIGLIDIRIGNFSNDAELMITQDYVLILDTSLKNKNPCGFMIKNKVFVALFNEIFEQLWNNAKK